MNLAAGLRFAHFRDTIRVDEVGCRRGGALKLGRVAVARRDTSPSGVRIAAGYLRSTCAHKARAPTVVVARGGDGTGELGNIADRKAGVT